ncbi:MAG TPA: redoxin domain-containing protein [Myxococcales bacterium]|nr:redoxin domain-containing protein [Myxococcales bacterium]
MQAWDPAAPGVGEKLPDLELLDEAGRPLALSSLPGRGALLILFFADPGDPQGLRLLADYRDSTLALFRAGVTVCAIGHADPAALRFLRSERGLGFAMLADPDATALSRLGMLERTGVFLAGRDLTLKLRSLGSRAAADAMVAFARRGGARTRVPLKERAAHFFQAVQHALRPLKPIR